ncbi:hypothetical protein [Nocardia sp. SC052]|uniref:hypothetical protein n=1 Tax=Nocardia sichangensis TaxID=3385975 RepID=UPI0039A25B7C
MSARRYRKRPIVVEAMQWTGYNAAQLRDWTVGAFHAVDPEDRTEDSDPTGDLLIAANNAHVGIETGEWIIRDSKGFYPCKPDIFEQTYEDV